MATINWIGESGGYQDTAQGFNPVAESGGVQEQGGPVIGANAFEFDSASDPADTYDVYAYQENGADVSDVVLVGSYTIAAGGGGGPTAGTLSLMGVGT